MIGHFCLQIANKVPDQLELSSPNRSAAASSDVGLYSEQNYNITDLLSDMQSNIPKLNSNSISKWQALALASSGKTATSLPDGRIAHSALKLPLRCPAAKRSISWDIFTTIAGNWERKGDG
ncbi:unnamed protein product [Onchocerca ochengi]|uniref:DNA helicase n=1 Tax=Onchocerca ochengi TaxID=42157 RepID=A0A182EX05_ONCOC|nr:unnamed protein product [Onchocerca ochengi]